MNSAPAPVQTVEPRRARGSWQAQQEWALPLRRVDAVQIVFDGARRLLWSGRGPGVWRPERIWPSPAERARLVTDLESGTPTLVVLEPGSVPVPVLPEELDRAPRRLRARAIGLGGDEHAVPITILDWLPERHRRGGLDFLQTARRMIESDPKLLLSSFVVDQAARPDAPLRFAVRAWPRAVADRDLAEFAASLFPQHAAHPTVPRQPTRPDDRPIGGHASVPRQRSSA